MTIKVVGVDPKSYFWFSYVALHDFYNVEQNWIFQVLHQNLLWNSVGRPFDIDRSNYVVTDYHIELVQMITALELADLSISDYSCTFDDFIVC